MKVVDRGMEHPISYDHDNQTLDRLANDFETRGVDFVQQLSLIWDLETPFDLFHDISPQEFKDGLVVREVTTISFHDLLGLPKQYRPSNFWNTPAKRKTAGIINDIVSGKALTPPWLIFDQRTSSFYVRSGHNRFAIAFINHSEMFPILLTPGDATAYDQRTEQAGDGKPDPVSS